MSDERALLRTQALERGREQGIVAERMRIRRALEELFERSEGYTGGDDVWVAEFSADVWKAALDRICPEEGGDDAILRLAEEVERLKAEKENAFWLPVPGEERARIRRELLEIFEGDGAMPRSSFRAAVDRVLPEDE